MCNSKCGCDYKGGCTVVLVAKILLLVGGINWGLVGLGMFLGGDWNIVRMVFGSLPSLEATVYVLVGIAAVASIFNCGCKKCASCDCGADGKTEVGA